LVGDLKSVWKYPKLPLEYLAVNLLPSDHAPDFIKLGYAAMWIILYFIIFIGTWTVIEVLLKRGYQQEVHNDDSNGALLFTEEISAALEAINSPNSTKRNRYV
jgi:hypothetical protein